MKICGFNFDTPETKQRAIHEPIIKAALTAAREMRGAPLTMADVHAVGAALQECDSVLMGDIWACGYNMESCS